MDHSRKRICAYVFAFAVLTCAYKSFAANPAPAVQKDFGNTAPRAPVDSAEALLTKVHLNNLAEIEAGERAREMGASMLLRAYGDRLTRDHRQVELMVMEMATQLGVAVRAVRAVNERAAMKMASQGTSQGTMDSRKFDQDFLNQMIEAHQRELSALSAAYSQQPPGSPLRVFLGKLLPILKQHLQVAQNLKPWV